MVTHHRSTPQRPSRVVVLGATGCVGRDLMTHLTAQGIETLALGSVQVNLCAPESVEALRQLIQRDDTVAILSALTPDKGRDVRTFMKNLAMGEHLSAVLQQTPCSHVIYISSDAVYADELSLIRETSCTSPSTFHGLMHLAREQMLAQALASAQIPLMILRPCAVYGASDTHNAYGPNRFLRSAISDHNIVLFGEGEEQRDHVYVGDLSRLIGLCVTHRTAGVLNVATDTAVSFMALARMVAELLEEPLRIETVPRQSAVTHRYFDRTALLRAFPAFQMTPLSDGLVTTYRRMIAPPVGSLKMNQRQDERALGSPGRKQVEG